MSTGFCNYLNKNVCSRLNAPCFRLQQQEKCEFQNHYVLVSNTLRDPPISKKVKEALLQPFLEKWTDFAISPSTGKKNMTGQPLEQAIRTVTQQELSKLGATVVNRAKKINIGEDAYILADVLVEKPNYPTSIISVKSWIGTTQIRETFGYAYLGKLWNGQKNIRVYMVSLYPIEKRLKKVEDICRPYLDGIYSISQNPYFDDLIQELNAIYQ